VPVSERIAAVDSFNNDPQGYMVFIGNLYAGSVGLDLHLLCNWFDPPANAGQSDQSIGRLRRIGQKKVVEMMEVSTQSSFDDRVLRNFIRKTLSHRWLDRTPDLTPEELSNVSMHLDAMVD